MLLSPSMEFTLLVVSLATRTCISSILAPHELETWPLGSANCISLTETWSPGSATCITDKFGHQVAPLALLYCLGLSYWHNQLVWSWYLHQPNHRLIVKTMGTRNVIINQVCKAKLPKKIQHLFLEVAIQER